MNFFISTLHAAETAPDASQQASPFSSLIIFAVLFGVMWFFLIRPQTKKQKQHRLLVSNIKEGDEVVMIGGIIGKIKKLEEDSLELESAGSMLVFQRQAVQNILPKGSVK